MNALDRLLSSPLTECRVFNREVSIHWFPLPTDGARCYCGQTIRTAEDDEDAAGGRLLEDYIGASPHLAESMEDGQP